MTDLLVLCTGNAARSVMAGFMLETLDVGRGGTDLQIVTAGTHTIDGQPMGMRTRLAMSGIAVYGVMLAGWSSGSKYPLLGSVRASAQVILMMGGGRSPLAARRGQQSRRRQDGRQPRGALH